MYVRLVSMSNILHIVLCFCMRQSILSGYTEWVYPPGSSGGKLKKVSDNLARTNFRGDIPVPGQIFKVIIYTPGKQVLLTHGRDWPTDKLCYTCNQNMVLSLMCCTNSSALKLWIIKLKCINLICEKFEDCRVCRRLFKIALNLRLFTLPVGCKWDCQNLDACPINTVHWIVFTRVNRSALPQCSVTCEEG